MADWKIKENRFVAFFDILGFKETVMHNSHDSIFSKLEHLKRGVDILGSLDERGQFSLETLNLTRAVTFSDSIIIFSKSDSLQDASKILVDCFILLHLAFKNSIPIKGAISFGEISVDFQQAIFFGKPIIDAYLLHEDLKMLTVICDHVSERKFSDFNLDPILKSILVSYKANMSYGRTTHTLLSSGTRLDQRIQQLDKLYADTSGKPRIYLDNTKEFLDYLKSLREQGIQ